MKLKSASWPLSEPGALKAFQTKVPAFQGLEERLVGKGLVGLGVLAALGVGLEPGALAGAKAHLGEEHGPAEAPGNVGQPGGDARRSLLEVGAAGPRRGGEGEVGVDPDVVEPVPEAHVLEVAVPVARVGHRAGEEEARGGDEVSPFRLAVHRLQKLDADAEE